MSKVKNNESKILIGNDGCTVLIDAFDRRDGFELSLYFTPEEARKIAKKLVKHAKQCEEDRS